MQPPPQADPETGRLRARMRGLKERVAGAGAAHHRPVELAFDREFEKLKQMD